MQTIKYISNTCDSDNLGEYGEHLIAIHDGKVVFHHDHSDRFLDIEDSLSAQKSIAKQLKVNLDDLTFEEILDATLQPDTFNIVNDYLKRNT